MLLTTKINIVLTKSWSIQVRILIPWVWVNVSARSPIFAPPCSNEMKTNFVLLQLVVNIPLIRIAFPALLCVTPTVFWHILRVFILRLIRIAWVCCISIRMDKFTSLSQTCPISFKFITNIISLKIFSCILYRFFVTLTLNVFCIICVLCQISQCFWEIWQFWVHHRIHFFTVSAVSGLHSLCCQWIIHHVLGSPHHIGFPSLHQLWRPDSSLHYS